MRQGYSVRRVCAALGLHRSTVYQRRTRDESTQAKEPVLDEVLVEKIRAILDREETFGYRRVWAELRFKEGISVNAKKVHRIMKVKGWQCRVWNRPGRKGPRISKRRSAVDVPDELWSTDLTKVYCGHDGWCPLIAVADNGSREITGFRFGRRGRAIEATDALERALQHRYGSKEAVPEGLRLRSDNGSIFLAEHYLRTTKVWGISQEYIPGNSPECNGVIERFFRTLKQECVWLHHFESFEEAEYIISEWIRKYNHERLHSALGYRTPVEWRENFYAVPQAA